MKTTTSAIIMVAIMAAMLVSGCMETITTTESGTQTHNIATGKTIEDVDFYKDGLHFSGQSVYQDGDHVRTYCAVEGYWGGDHITGTMEAIGSGNGYYILHAKVDRYAGGLHVTGERTFNGFFGEDEWFYTLEAHDPNGVYKSGMYRGYGDSVEWIYD